MKQLEVADIPDAASVERAADAFSKLGPAVDEAMDQVKRAWSRLAETDVLDIPNSTQVFTAMSGPVDLASTIGQDASGARSALLAYSTALAALGKQRPEMVDALAGAVASHDMSVMQDQGSLVSEDAIDQAGLPAGMRVSAFNHAAESADEECAEALLKLYRYPGDQAAHGLQAIGGVTESFWGALAIEATKTAAEKWSTLRDAALSITDARGLTSPTGRREAAPAPDSAVSAEGDESRAVRVAAQTVAETDEATSAGSRIQAGSAVLEGGAKALGVAGAVVSVGVNFAEDYDKNEAKHPEWSGGDRVAHAGLATGVTTAASVALSIETAESGAEIGMAIGTFIEPGGGTVLGGIIGGVIGGVAGGMAGGDLGKTAMGLLDKVFGI